MKEKYKDRMRKDENGKGLSRKTKLQKVKIIHKANKYKERQETKAREVVIVLLKRKRRTRMMEQD